MYCRPEGPTVATGKPGTPFSTGSVVSSPPKPGTAAVGDGRVIAAAVTPSASGAAVTGPAKAAGPPNGAPRESLVP